MNNLYQFLTEMALNPQTQVSFGENPAEIVKKAGVSEIEQHALRSGNRAKLAAAFVDELETRALVAVMGNCFGSDPGPDPDPDPDPFPGDRVPEDPSDSE